MFAQLCATSGNHFFFAIVFAYLNHFLLPFLPIEKNEKIKAKIKFKQKQFIDREQKKNQNIHTRMNGHGFQYVLYAFIIAKKKEIR